MAGVTEKWNAVAGHRWLRFFYAGLIFVLIFWYPWEMPEHVKAWESRHGDAYYLTPDTPSYIDFRAWKHPWLSMRPFGYPAILYLVLGPDRGRLLRAYWEGSREALRVWTDPDQPIYTIPRKLGIDGKFAAIALAQRVILALSIAVFYLSICRWLGQFFAFVALVAALCLSPPPPPHGIITEPLSCALTWLCAAFLLQAGRCRRQRACCALACLCAGAAFLIRPQTLSLTGLCSLLFLYQVFIAGRKHLLTAFFKQAVAFSPLLLAYGYIAWLSVTGGHLFLHTMNEAQYVRFCYYAEAEDAQHMPTERARKVTEWYAQEKDALARTVRLPSNPSPPKKEHAIGAEIVFWHGTGGIWKHFKDVDGIGNLDRLGKSIFGRELVAGLQARHGVEMLVSRWQHFISGFGYYRDVYRLALFPRTTFALNILALALSLGAIAWVAGARWAVVILLGIHIMALIAASLGNVMLQRYVEPTVPFFFLAAFWSCRALAGKVYARWKGRRASREPLGSDGSAPA